MKNRFLLIAVWILALALSACEKDEETIVDGSDQISAETLATNKWIKEIMEEEYLWNNQLPVVDVTKENDSFVYFEKLRYKEDKWSWLTDDYASLAAEFAGTPVTMGFDPKFYLFTDETTVFIVVNYVYPNSPAAEAGIKRGDIILEINNTSLNIDNYYELYSGQSYSVQLGQLDGNSIGLSGASYNLTARVVSTDPSIYHHIFELEGKKIGYLVYTEFVAGVDDKFLGAMDAIFNEFKAAGVTELVVDLRYNPGGEIDAAAYLASAIGPASVVSNHSTLVTMRYNMALQAYIESKPQYAHYLSYKFVDNSSNLNLSSVYFLTTNGTASASELLMIGLSPYMNVVHIGENTHGKYTGAWVIPDDNDEWCVVPIVMKYANIDGLTDFKTGLTPDFEIEDDLLHALPFGDPTDPMLAKAISEITGTVVATASLKSARIPIAREIRPKQLELKRNLFVPADLQLK